MGSFLFLLAHISTVYLSWVDDPTTSMTVQWISSGENFSDAIELGESVVSGKHFCVDDVVVHKVTLGELTPGTEYAFRIEGDSSVYRFQTAPKTLDKPLRFLIGNDFYTSRKAF